MNKAKEITEIMDKMVVSDEISSALSESKKFDHLDTGGCRKMVLAIIEQAIFDYKSMEKAGIIRNGKIVKEFPAGKTIKGMSKLAEVAQLLYWFQSDELETLIDLACIKITAEAIREELGIGD